MKIIYLTDQVFLHGGVEKVLSQKANWLAEAGHKVFIITSRQQNRSPVYVFSNRIRCLDLRIDYEISKSYFSLENLKKLPLHFRRVKKQIEEFRPDVIINCSYTPDFYFLPYICRGIPKIKEYHSSGWQASVSAPGLKEKWMRRLDAATEKKYQQIVVLNEDEKKYHHGKISVIPNPAESSSGNADLSSKQILAAGRLSPVKNFETLIECFVAIQPEFPDWQLHIYGEDYLSTKEKLKKQIDDLKMHNAVKLMGVSADMKNTINKYSIYAMTSHTECFPMVLLEALSAGVPVVTWDAPTGPKWIVTDGEDGYVTAYQDHKKFTEALRKMMSSEDLRLTMGAKAKKNVQRFSTDVVMARWEELFLSLQIDKKADRV